MMEIEINYNNHNLNIKQNMISLLNAVSYQYLVDNSDIYINLRIKMYAHTYE